MTLYVCSFCFGLCNIKEKQQLSHISKTDSVEMIKELKKKRKNAVLV